MGENLSLQTSCSRLSYGYRYEKNLQGDIVAIYNASGTKLVSYVYDAWGNVSRSYHNNGNDTGAAIGGIIGGLSAALSGGDTADIIIGIGSGMLSGALTASGIGVAGQVVGSAAISMLSNATS